MQRLSDYEVEVLTHRLRLGDTHVRDALIESHMPLAIHLAQRYPKGKRDDYIAQAFLGVTQAVDWAPTRLTDDNISPYVRVTIRRFLNEFFTSDSLLPIERRAYAKMAEENKFVPYVRTIEAVEDDEENYVPSDDLDVCPAVVDDEALVGRELYNHVVKDGKTQTIIEGLMKGLSMEAIGASMGCSKQYISKQVAIIRERTEVWQQR